MLGDGLAPNAPAAPLVLLHSTEGAVYDANYDVRLMTTEMAG